MRWLTGSCQAFVRFPQFPTDQLRHERAVGFVQTIPCIVCYLISTQTRGLRGRQHSPPTPSRLSLAAHRLTSTLLRPRRHRRDFVT